MHLLNRDRDKKVPLTVSKRDKSKAKIEMYPNVLLVLALISSVFSNDAVKIIIDTDMVDIYICDSIVV